MLYSLVHVAGETTVLARVRRAESFWQRGVGLLSRQNLAAGEGLWLPETSSVHTLGMKFPIDIMFLDARDCMVGCEVNVPAGRLWCAAKGARSVVEASAGVFAPYRTNRGDTWRFEPFVPG